MIYQTVIEIGGIPIQIETEHELSPELYTGYFTDKQTEISIRSSACGSGKSTPIKTHERRTINEQSEWILSNAARLESQEIQRKIAERMLDEGYLLLHGAAVAKDGEAYIFTAPSGTGKTTRIRFWMEMYPDSVIVNGDKPMICMTRSRLMACGTPWAGKEGWSRNIQVPIRAIYLLERAEQDSVTEISMAEAWPTLMRQTYIDQESDVFVKRIKMLKMMEGKVRLFRFQSTMTAESVRMAYEAAQAAGPII